ncbi:hypothetical protein D3C79_793220 [compost metagenome]
MRGDADVATELGQHAFSHQLVHRVVLDQQDMCTALAVQSALVRVEIDTVGTVQRASQGLVQGVARQWPGLLLQGRQMHGLFTRKKVAVGGHQQNRRLYLRAKRKQVVQVVGNQQVRVGVTQLVRVVVAPVIQAPAR